VVQSMLAQVGIRVKILQLDSASYYALRKDGKMQAYETYWSADYNDPDNFIYTFFSEDNSATRAFNYTNKKVFAKLEEARKMVDQNKRIKLYQELEKTIAQDDAAWVPLFSTNQLFVVQPRVKHFRVSWNGWSDMSYNGISVE
ncbi:MAG TPA: ABC transporter substrate-binding protein, partial [Holophaga sp.]|nr:ABC transporter substrate-binding protein [Holophaga sp.]